MAVAPNQAAVAVANNAAATTITGTYGSQPPVGDYLLAYVGFIGSGTLTPPAGWSTLFVSFNGTLCALGVYYRVAQAGDPLSWTFTCTVSDYLALALDDFSGQGTATPAYALNNSTTGTSVTTPSATPPQPNSYPVAVVTENNNWGNTPNAPFTARASAIQNYHSLFTEIAPLVSSPTAVTFSFGGSTACVAAIILIAPPASGSVSIGNGDNPGGNIGNGNYASGSTGNGRYNTP